MVEKPDAVSRTKLTDEALRHLAPLTHLRYLTLPSTCTDKEPAHLSELNELHQLVLLGETSDAGLSNLRLDRKQQLRTLRITGGEGLQSLAKMSNLRSLHLIGTSVGGGMLASVSHCPRLRVLSVSPVDIDDDDLQPLTRLRLLEYLSLSEGSKVSVAGLLHLASLSKLRALTIDGSRFDAACIPLLKELSNLQMLDFANSKPPEEIMVKLKSALPDVNVK